MSRIFIIVEIMSQDFKKNPTSCISCPLFDVYSFLILWSCYGFIFYTYFNLFQGMCVIIRTLWALGDIIVSLCAGDEHSLLCLAADRQTHPVCCFRAAPCQWKTGRCFCFVLFAVSFILMSHPAPDFSTMTSIIFLRGKFWVLSLHESAHPDRNLNSG